MAGTLGAAAYVRDDVAALPHYGELALLGNGT